MLVHNRSPRRPKNAPYIIGKQHGLVVTSSVGHRDWRQTLMNPGWVTLATAAAGSCGTIRDHDAQ